MSKMIQAPAGGNMKICGNSKPALPIKTKPKPESKLNPAYEYAPFAPNTIPAITVPDIKKIISKLRTPPERLDITIVIAQSVANKITPPDFT